MWHFCSSHFSQCNGTDSTVLLPSRTWTTEVFLEWKGLLPCVCTAVGPQSCLEVPQYPCLVKRSCKDCLSRSVPLFFSNLPLCVASNRTQKMVLSLGTSFSFPACCREMKTEVFFVKCLYAEYLQIFFKKISVWSILLTAMDQISGVRNRQVAFPPNLPPGCNKLCE